MTKMNKKLKELEKKAKAAQKAFITADALYDDAVAYLDTANDLYDDAEVVAVAAVASLDTAYDIANKANNKANRAIAAYRKAYRTGEIK